MLTVPEMGDCFALNLTSAPHPLIKCHMKVIPHTYAYKM